MAEVAITLVAKTMDGLDVVDPQLLVKIDQTAPFQRPLGTKTVTGFSGQITLNMDAPEAGQVEWMVTAMFSKFLAQGGLMFFPNVEPSKKFELELTRNPSSWNAKFEDYAILSSPRFDALKTVIAVSTNVDLKAAGVVAIGNLQQQYDLIDGGPQRLAKAALLNLYAVLTDELDPVGHVAWFSYVQKIVRIDQERFVAEVDGAMFANVTAIIQELSAKYAEEGYSTEPSGDAPLHYVNIPKSYDCPNSLATPLITVKKKYEQGNVQLTLTSYKNGVFLLDCDMDEHLEIVEHTGDIAKNIVAQAEDPTDTGTQPFLMHEYIVRDSAQAAADGISTVELGYWLV
jgi:hypothetical protein